MPQGQRVPVRGPRPQRLRHVRRRQVAPRAGAGDGDGGVRGSAGRSAAGSSASTASSAGETDQYHPDLVHDNHQVDPPRTPEEGYHLTEDLADRAIGYIKDLRATSADRPFFLYFAPGACHAPHQVPEPVPGPLPRPLRPGLGPVARGGLRPPAGVRPAARRHRGSASGRRGSRRGTRSATTSAGCTPG